MNLLRFITDEKMIYNVNNVSIYRSFKYTVDMLKMSKKMIFMAPGYKALFKTIFDKVLTLEQRSNGPKCDIK